MPLSTHMLSTFVFICVCICAVVSLRGADGSQGIPCQNDSDCDVKCGKGFGMCENGSCYCGVAFHKKQYKPGCVTVQECT